jgi:hypothetical protein
VLAGVGMLQIGHWISLVAGTTVRATPVFAGDTDRREGGLTPR